MAAFDRILSGIPEMDKALDNIRLGDNVVWRVSDLSEFRLFMEPYVRQAVKDKRKIIYFRFAAHEPFITDIPEVKTIEIPLSHRFENFTVEIHNAIFLIALKTSLWRYIMRLKEKAGMHFMFSTAFRNYRLHGRQT